jgi:hypothetical protein
MIPPGARQLGEAAPIFFLSRQELVGCHFKLVLQEQNVFTGALYVEAQPHSAGVSTLISICLCILSLDSVALAFDWKREVIGRWGFAVTYPSSLVPELLPENGAGRRYHSADHQVSLFVAGSHTFPEDSLDNFWRKELNTRGETVTYKFKKDNYYVISGVNPNGYEFYHKVFFYPTYWLEFEITYPHAEHAIYDAWVERIAHDFVPVLPDNGQYDR